MNNNAPVALLDDARKHGERRWQTGIPIGEDVDIRALGPGLVYRSMDSFLYIFTVEIYRGLRLGEGTPGKKIISANAPWGTYHNTLRETQDIPENGILPANQSLAWKSRSRDVLTVSKIL